jgi:phosphoglycerate dehydrogenase-like enzyme
MTGKGTVAATAWAGGRPRIAVAHDYLGVAETLVDWAPVRARADVDFLTEAYADDDEAAAALADYDIVCALRERQPLSAGLIDKLPKLRLFVAASEVNRRIDFEAADARGIEVAGTPSGAYARAATAELTWGLIIAATRGIVEEDRSVREGRWQTRVFPTLTGKTIGIVGLGGTGRYIARFAREFGMNVLAWSRNLTAMTALEVGAEVVSLDELLERSDVVSLHLVLSETTRGIIDARRIGLLKPGAVFVNTSRGGLVDETALIDALRDRRIAGAALDVFETEPLPPGHALLELDNVILSPHAGGFVEETYRSWYAGTVEAVLAFLDDREIPVRHARPRSEPGTST